MSFLQDHAFLAKVHAGLGGALVGAVLQADDAFRRPKGLLRKVSWVSF